MILPILAVAYSLVAIGEQKTSEAIQARPFGSLRSQFGVNTRGESAHGGPYDRNLFDWINRAEVGVDLKLSPSLRLYVEGKTLWRGTAQRDFDRAKAFVEPQLGEAFVDWYSQFFDLRVGSQLVVFGANALWAPADQLNPRDLRFGFLQSDPEDVKLPSFAARAVGDVWGLHWTAAYFPFFAASRYALYGQNQALIQPALARMLPTLLADPSIEDRLQSHLLETRRPNAFPYLGDLGLRVTTDLLGAKVGISWIWMNEKLPQVRINPAFGLIVPPPAAQTLSFNPEALLIGTYERQHVLSAESSFLVGSTQIDLDASFLPEQLFYDGSLRPLRKANLTWVAGISQAEESKLFYNLTYVGLAVMHILPGESLFLLEVSSPPGATRAALFHFITGLVGYRLGDGRFELSLRAAFEVSRRSYALGPRLSYRWSDHFSTWLGGEYYSGEDFSAFGYLKHDDQILAGARLSLF